MTSKNQAKTPQMSILHICSESNFSMRTIRQILELIAPQSNKQKKQMLNRIERLIEQGMDENQILKELNLT